MKPERWKKIETICQEAMTLSGEERTTYIENSCAGDPDLLDEVNSLLAQETSGWMEEPLVDMQSSLLFTDEEKANEQVIGPYRLIRKIGSGGMGHVYLAVRNDKQFERFVALKVIRKGVISDDVLTRFYEERQILASLNHPNIARLFDGGTTEDDLPWFAMEFVEGTPVTDYCKRHQSTLEERLDLFLEICSAVQYAHQNLIVHRDLKPANILITEAGRPKLLDFGIAKLMDLDQKQRKAQYQNRMMTPEYASPEQVRNEPISTVSDLYSLGVLLYELLAGDLPYHFEKRTPANIEKTICNQIPEIPSKIKGAIHSGDDLDAIVLKALKKDPTERYSSVEQFADDVRRYQKTLPVVAKKDSISYRSGKFIRRHTIGIAASAVIALLVISFASVTYIQSKAIEERAIEAENERDRAEEVSRFLIDLFESVDPSEAQDQSLSAVELLHRGAGRVETELNDQPDLQSELYLVVSDVYESLGLYRQGFEMAEKALQLQRKLYGEIHPDIARSLNSLGWLQYQIGNYDRADSLLNAALTMRKQLFDHENLEVARTLNDLAVLKQSMSDFQATDSLLSKALEIRRSVVGESHESVGVALSNYAALKWRMNDLTAAAEMMRESLDILVENNGKENLQVASIRP
ncbi:MAG: serine/threonine-protein kinase [Balneolaceae bacterium]|nr:serine/threonine-protein kinase [Balneolaceae bacterium]